MDKINGASWLISLVFLLLTGSTEARSQGREHQEDIDTLCNRLAAICLRQKATMDATATRRPDGSWQDIDYTDTVQASFRTHAARMKNMALAYSDPANPLYHSGALSQQLQKAFEFFYDKKWKASNWWYIDIGVPDDYMVALLLMKQVFTREQLLRYGGFLKDATGNAAHKGMNRLWVSRITIYKGSIEDNYPLIERGFTSAASTLALAEPQGNEGIKNDWSFHQHRAQLYSGGYGMAFANDMTELKWLSTGTSFARLFTKEQASIFSSLLLEGHLRLGFRDVVDFGTVGRSLSRPGALKNVDETTLDR
ncbi:MAG: alpha-galactosidase, partial [Bacteroidetes bacterium]|nr:alpha-galactosidase [Bacteroidota bacterium]